MDLPRSRAAGPLPGKPCATKSDALGRFPTAEPRAKDRDESRILPEQIIYRLDY